MVGCNESDFDCGGVDRKETGDKAVGVGKAAEAGAALIIKLKGVDIFHTYCGNCDAFVLADDADYRAGRHPMAFVPYINIIRVSVSWR